MKKIILASALGLTIAAAGIASASDVVPNLNAGTKSLDISGSYDASTALDYSVSLDGGFGYFFIDNLEVIGVAGWQGTSLADTFELGAEVQYNIPTGTPWVPFVGMGVLWAGTEIDDDFYEDEDDFDKDAWLGRFMGGVKYFFRDDIALNLNMKYDVASKDVYGNDDGGRDGYNWSMGLGINFYFD